MLESHCMMIQEYANDYDFSKQVEVEFEAEGMRFLLHHFIDDEISSLYQLLDALCILRADRRLLKSLKDFGRAHVDVVDENTGETSYEVSLSSRYSNANFESISPETMVTTKIGDYLMVSMPQPSDWERSGLGWLNNFCSECDAVEMESLPWRCPNCKRPSSQTAP